MREIRERSGKVEGGSEISVELQKQWENLMEMLQLSSDSGSDDDLPSFLQSPSSCFYFR